MIKHLLVFISIILALTCGYLGIKLHIANAKIPSQAKAPVRIDTSISVTPSLVYKDSKGIEHTVIDNNLNSIIDQEATRQAAGLQPVIDQVANNLNIKPSQVEAVTEIATKTVRDSLAFMKKQLENATKLTFYYKDKYLTLKVNTNPLDTLDIGNFSYSYNDSLKIVQYHKKAWFLAAKKSYIDISSADPNTTVMGVKKLTIEQRTPEFGMRLQATVGWNPVTHVKSFGPSVRIDLGNKLKASIRTSALYDIHNNRWGIGISLDKDLKRF